MIQSDLVRVSINRDWVDKPVKNNRGYLTYNGRSINPAMGWVNIEAPYEEVFDLVTTQGFSICAQLQDGYRKDRNFISHSLVLVDIDTGSSINNIRNHDFYQKYAGGYYATPSHSEEHHRFRLIFRLEKDITSGAELKYLYTGLIRMFHGDYACKDPSRFFYGNRTTIKEIRKETLPQQVVGSLITIGQELDPIDDEKKFGAIDYTPLSVERRAYFINKLKLVFIGYEPQWYRVGLAMCGAGFTVEDFITVTIDGLMNQKDGEACRAKWRAIEADVSHRINFGYVINLLKEHEVDISDMPPMDRVRFNYHQDSDLANAWRIIAHFGEELLTCNEEWYTWNKAYWERGRTGARKIVFNLSSIIQKEIGDFRCQLKTSKNPENINMMIKGLSAWSKQSESNARLDAALSILKDKVIKPSNHIDSHPHLINVKNGTVDLRTGDLRQHSREDFITQCIPYIYNPSIDKTTFKTFVEQVVGEEGTPDTPVADFLQRWFGYCLTGLTHEHKFVVHWGDGSNGKSTLLNAIAHVMGSYAGVATPRLLEAGVTSSQGIEAADLYGKRMVISHESGEDIRLREDFVKQVTGGDIIKGRFLYKHYFEFVPTHKLQLCTNHKPVIRGGDFGIWRRIVLVPYLQRFVTNPTAGKKDKLLDKDLLHRLITHESEAILAWLVQGAVLWNREGLNPPEIIMAAGREYIDEQDRIKHFIDDEIIVVKDAWTPLNQSSRDVYGRHVPIGIYPAYIQWCKDSGYYALGKIRFNNGLKTAFINAKINAEWIQKNVGRGKYLRKTWGYGGITLAGDVLPLAEGGVLC